jgi:hypothetical protein
MIWLLFAKTNPMKKNSLRPLLPGAAGSSRRPGYSRRLAAILLGSLVALCACGELRPRPAAFDPQVYTPIQYQDLLAPRQAGLHAGQKIRVKAYFWQYLDYDPAMIRNYLTLPKYPLRWYRLRWFATYGTAELTGYYDLAALSPEQADEYQLQRLDPVWLYGELSSLGPGLYLQVFYIEKTKEN